MVNEWVAVIAAAMGAGGAVIAQIVGSAFSASREAKRLKWEKSIKQQEWEQLRAERFLDLKRDLYSQYLALSYMLISDPNSKLDEEGRTGQYQALATQFSQHEDELNHLRWNIRLIAPQQVWSNVELTYTLLVTSQMVFYRPDKFSQKHRKRTATNALHAWQDLSNLMRADLDASPDALDRTTRAIRERPKRDPDEPVSDLHESLNAKLDELLEFPGSFPPAQRDYPSERTRTNPPSEP